MAGTREPAIEGYRAIAAALSEEWGNVVSEDAAYRSATRKEFPLPTDGYAGRVWTTRSAIAKWVAEERQRRRRAPVTTSQLGLFDGDNG